MKPYSPAIRAAVAPRPTLAHRARTALLTLALGGAAALASGTASAQPPKLISISTFNAGSYTYAEVTAMADAISKQFESKIRVIPFGNSVGRAAALKAGKSDFWMSCSAYYTAFEGIGDFAAKQWGPQPLRILLLSNRIANFSFATNADNPIGAVADIKGKRVSWVVGNSGINMQTEAYLAYAGLSKADVSLVDFPGYVASLRGLINGQADVVMASNSSSAVQEISASPRGLKWVPMPHDDEAAWKRVQTAAPFVAPISIDSGAGVPSGQTIEVGSYPCPTYVTYADASEDKAYWLTKMIVESFDGYKDAIKSSPYWQVDNALRSRAAVPYHAGAVKYFKEAGKWSDALEAQNQALIARDGALQKAFAEAKASYTGDDEGFPAFWESKKAALPAM